MREISGPRDTNVKEKSKAKNKEQVRGESQKTRTPSLSKKIMGGTIIVMLTGSAMADLSGAQPRSSALDLRGSNNLTDYISPPPLPSPEYLKKIGEDSKRLDQEASQETPGEKTPPDLHSRKMGPREKTSRSTIETPPSQLVRSESKGRESLESSNKVLAPKENRAVQKSSQDVLNNKEIIGDINNLLNNKELGKDILLALKNQKFLKNLPLLCQRPKFQKFLGALVKNQNTMDSLRSLYQDQKFVEDVSKLCQKPEIEESLRLLFNDQVLQHNLAPRQEHPEKQGIDRRKLLWQIGDMDNSDSDKYMYNGDKYKENEHKSHYRNKEANEYSSEYDDSSSTGYKSRYRNKEADEYSNEYDDSSSTGYKSHYRNKKTDEYKNDYMAGKADGYDSGYNDGETSGYNDGETSGYNKGYDDGYDDGKSIGYKLGYADGKTKGYNNGYDEGKLIGYKHGLTDGKTTGYSKGLDEGKLIGYKLGFEAGKAIGYDVSKNQHVLGYDSLDIQERNYKSRGKSTYGTTLISIFIVLSALACIHKYCNQKKKNYNHRNAPRRNHME